MEAVEMKPETETEVEEVEEIDPAAKEFAEKVQASLNKHNCKFNASMIIRGTSVDQVMKVESLPVAGESEEDAQKRQDACRDEVDALCKDSDYHVQTVCNVGNGFCATAVEIVKKPSQPQE